MMLSEPRTNTTRRASERWPSNSATTGSLAMIGPASDRAASHGPLAETCRFQTRRLLGPRQKRFSPPPDSVAMAAILLFTWPPRDAQPDQTLLGDTCARCQTALSVLRTKTSNRPSQLRVTVGSLVRM